MTLPAFREFNYFIRQDYQDFLDFLFLAFHLPATCPQRSRLRVSEFSRDPGTGRNSEAGGNATQREKALENLKETEGMFQEMGVDCRS